MIIAAAGHATPVAVKRLTRADLRAALRAGWADFAARPSHLLFLGLIYPAGALIAAWATLGANLTQLVYPALTGLALTGPFAALVLYEMSRLREAGRDASWWDALQVLSADRLGPILTLGAVLAVVFAAWLTVAQMLFAAIMGPEATAMGPLVTRVLTTPEGLRLLVFGNVVGFGFALAVLATNVVAFPMLVDRKTTPLGAIAASLRVFAANPMVMSLWGLTIAVLMVAGAAALGVGLAVVLPVLGHASWHLYRRAVG